MNFEYTEEQRLLAESVRRFVARDYGFEARKKILASREGASEAAWNELAGMGLLGLGLPPEHGGFGGGAVDLMGVMEAFGEALVVEPYLSTVIGARFIARGGTASQREALLPAIAGGKHKLAFAHTEAGSRYDLGRVSTRVRRDGNAHIVDGEKRVVVDGPHAASFVVTARGDQGLAVLLVDARAAGLRQAPARLLDGRRACDLSFEGVRVGPEAVVGIGADALALIEEVVDFATALVCAEGVGAMRHANDATLDYLKTRKQFGVPIGSFQALQHRMVDMVIECEQARSMASLACVRVDAPGDAADRKRVVSMAKIKVADACRHISQESVQLHGGMGMTAEMKVSHTFRRLTAIAQQFGDADHHLERVASLR
jgi:alkylation response protein AidB-like acyl-CoA dehydrogenase